VPLMTVGGGCSVTAMLGGELTMNTVDERKCSTWNSV
jgi:hypothetical protein